MPRSCNSSVSTQVQFSASDPQCIQCPEFVACQQATMRRMQQNSSTNRRQSLGGSYVPTSNSSTSSAPKQPTYKPPQSQHRSSAHEYSLQPESMLQYDILPREEEGETFMERILLNGASSAASAFANETSVLFRKHRFSFRRKKRVKE